MRRTIELEGHIFDSHLFEKVLDSIRDAGADYQILDVHSGLAPEDTSRARIEVVAPTPAVLDDVLAHVATHGARIVDATAHENVTDVPEGPLTWGTRYLMCPPEFFTVAYEINPWMHTEVRVDRDRAWEQWERLVDTLEDVGAAIERLEPVDGQPDYVFTANAGLVDGKTFIPASFKHPQRRGETPHATAWFGERGYRIAPLPEGHVHEGAGDALPFNDVVVSGYRIRSDARSHAAVARTLHAQVRAVELVDPRLYHLDLTFCPLDARRAIVVPDAWDEHGRHVMRALIPEPLELDRDEALAFVANSVVVGNTIVMPVCPTRIERALVAWGFEVAVVDVSEFLKAGGAVRCLTLALDVSLGRLRNEAPG